MNTTLGQEKSSPYTPDYTTRAQDGANIAQSPRADGSCRAVAEAQLPHEAGFTPRVYRTGDRRFAVDSTTDPDVTYFVQLRTPGVEPRCHCLGFQYRTHCRHIERAEERDGALSARRPADIRALDDVFGPAVAS